MLTTVTADLILADGPAGPGWLRDGHIAYRGSRIVSVGPGRGPDPDAAGERIELGEAVVLPGLIDLDALADIDHLILDAWLPAADSIAVAGSATYWREHRHDVLTPGQRDTMRRFALAQLALHGITSYMPIAAEVHTGWAEDADELRRMAEISRSIGLRGWLGPSYRSAVVADGGGTREIVVDDDLGRQGLLGAVDFAHWVRAREVDHADDLLHPVLLPCRIESVSAELLRQTATAARELGIPVRLHSLQQPWEAVLVAERDGCSPIELLERTGLLDCQLLIPHGFHVRTGPDGGDLPLLAERGVGIAHCPLTSLRYGKVLDSLTRYQDAGVIVSLGTDSFPPDLIRGIDAGLHVGRVLHGPESVGLARYLSAATVGGARSLRRPDLGRIQAGATADLSAFRLDDFRTGVREDPWRTLVFNGSGRDVLHTVVAGRTVVRDGALPGVDLARLRSDAQAVFDSMRAAYPERDRGGRDLPDLFPATFPDLLPEWRDGMGEGSA